MNQTPTKNRFEIDELIRLYLENHWTKNHFIRKKNKFFGEKNHFPRRENHEKN